MNSAEGLGTILIASHHAFVVAELASTCPHLAHRCQYEVRKCCLTIAMKPFTFIVSTSQDPPSKGSNIQAINAHCASFAHKRRNSKGQFSSLSNPQAARRILVQKVDPSPDITTCTDFTKKKSPIKDEKESSDSKTDQLRNHPKNLDLQQQKCTVCLQNDYSICLCAHTHDFDAQLLSILDPFTIVPLKLSRHEQKILQECTYSTDSVKFELSNLRSRSY